MADEEFDIQITLAPQKTTKDEPADEPKDEEKHAKSRHKKK